MSFDTSKYSVSTVNVNGKEISVSFMSGNDNCVFSNNLKELDEADLLTICKMKNIVIMSIKEEDDGTTTLIRHGSPFKYLKRYNKDFYNKYKIILQEEK